MKSHHSPHQRVTAQSHRQQSQEPRTERGQERGQTSFSKKATASHVINNLEPRRKNTRVLALYQKRRSKPRTQISGASVCLCSYQNPVVPTPSNTPLGSNPVSASTSFGKLLLGLPLPVELVGCTPETHDSTGHKTRIEGGGRRGGGVRC